MKLFAIFGNPISHSISPRLHNNVIQHLNLDACYTRKLITNQEDIIKTFKALKLTGANVTVPHKEAAYRLCDEVRGIANEIKAINTLVQEKGKIIGYNTDAPGFYQSLNAFKNIQKALIIGAGGTAKAIAFILRSHHIDVSVLNRSEARLKFFSDHDFSTFSWKDFSIDQYDIIINTTPAGLKDDTLPFETESLAKLMQSAHYAFDVIYGKMTPFLKLASAHDLIYKDGRDMLLYQGILAFNLFYNQRFDNKIIEKYMREALAF
ncbi:shikimate dehydrogenase [Sulfurospirillum sp. 1612]|uniref:shikimate dehydrogenase n=1 Tax=Sulfurospirillum sp. 1612 TaxID=3094835 RepID=UPI002F92A142